MRYSWILLFLAATTMVANGAVEDLRVDLKPLQQFFGTAQDIMVLLNVTNVGNELMGLLNVFDPLKELMDPIVNVFCNGQPIKYVGAVAKRRIAFYEDFVPLPPSSSITLPIKLSDVFNMTQACNYVVQLQMNAREFFATLGVKAKGPDSAVLVENKLLTTAPVALFADAHKNKILEDSTKIAQGRYLTPAYSGCSASQQSQLVSGLAQAERLVNDVSNYFASKTTATARYNTWYGGHTAANWNTAKTNWNNLKNTITAKAITFNCVCSGGSSGTYAYVYPSQPYHIYLCDQHWVSPMTGTDSQGGTILHEAAHFTVVAATKDHAYGQSRCKSLAVSNPAQALGNSDSYQYFSENNPFQS